MRWSLKSGCLAILVGGVCVLASQSRGADAPAERETLRYDGKPFEYWRTYMRTELKAERRTDAIRALAAFGVRGHASEATAAIVDAIKDYGADAYGDAKEPTPDQRLILAAVEAIVKMGPTAYEIVLRNAKDANGRQFANAVYGHSFADKRVNVLSAPGVRTLLRYVQGDDSEGRKFAVEILAHAIRNYSPSKDHVRAILHAERDTTRLVQALIEMLSEKGRDCYDLASVLETFGPRGKAAAPALVKARLGGEAIVDSTFKALGVEARELIPGITEGLKGPDAEVKKRAAEWLATLGVEAKDASPALLKGVQDGPKASTKRESSSSWQTATASPSLGESSEEENAWLAEVAALRRIGAEPRKLLAPLVRVVADRSRTLSCRVRAANTLQEVGVPAKEAAPSLLKVFAAEDEDARLRTAALTALRKIGVDSRQLVPELVKGMEHELDEHPNYDWCADPLAREVLTCLISLRPQAKEALPVLLRVFRQYKNDAELCPQLAQALGELGPSACAALPALREVAKSDKQRARKAAAAAIAKIEDKEGK